MMNPLEELGAVAPPSVLLFLLLTCNMRAAPSRQDKFALQDGTANLPPFASEVSEVPLLLILLA